MIELVKGKGNINLRPQEGRVELDVPTLDCESGGGGSGTDNYNALFNKPKINNVELSGNKTLDELGVQPKGDYVTNEQLTEGLNAKQPVGDYATKTELSQGLDKKQPKGDYALKSEIPVVPPIDAKGDNEVYLTARGDYNHTLRGAHAQHAKGSAKTPSTASIGAGATGTLKIPKIEANAGGHITSITEETVTITIPKSSGNGNNGEDGGYYMPKVTDGVLSWTSSKPNMPKIQDSNIKGKDGTNGVDGTNGKDGKDGYTPVKGVDYFDGKNGTNGTNGVDGKDGHTPQKGIDYWTTKDKQEIITDVLNSLPAVEGGKY